MSTPATPYSPTAVQPTRQQLDELDALMQRMLALPINPSGEEAGTITEPGTADATPPQQAALEPPPVLVEAQPARVLEWSFSRATSIRVQAREEANPTPAPLIPVEATPAPRPKSERQPPRVALWLRPAVWLNRVFDRATYLLGPLGRWLRGPTGRDLLGWTGVLLLVAAAAWGALDWMGWTW